MRIYTITCARAIDMAGAQDGMAGLIDAACIGFFSTMEDACAAVASNMGDMHEVDYGIVIVEGVDEGLYLTRTDDRAFFMWGTDGRYHECDWPEALSRMTGFSMG